jgi:RNA polymerase sigma-70 factor, ECF subfamily
MEQRDRFQSLTLPHLDRLVALAARWGSRTEAEDCVQETYLRAFRAFDQLRDPGAVFAWLCQILRTVANERHRTQVRRRELIEPIELEAVHDEMAASEDRSPLDQILARMERGQLRSALRVIPEDFAEAVELHDVYGLKYREIAEWTSVPIGTVMSRISR